MRDCAAGVIGGVIAAFPFDKLMAGQIAGMVRTRRSAAEIVADIVDGADALLIGLKLAADKGGRQ